jgi:hypothetical protein
VRLVSLVAVSITVAACGAATTSTRPSPAPAASMPDAAAIARCQRLQERLVTPCPPATLTLERIAIRNGTHGAVSDSDVRTQGLAYLRVHALYTWAVHQDAGDKFLLSGAIVPPETGRTNIFRAEVGVFADARTAGGRARIEPMTTTEVALVPVPDAIRAAAQRDGLQPSAFAWVDNQAGPAHTWIDLPNGTVREGVRIAAGQPHPILVFGQVRDDPELGSIWFLGGEYGCLASPQVRVVCGD